MPPPDVSVIVVSFNTRALLLRSLESVRRHVAVSHEVFVVDNASSDGSPSAVTEGFPDVRLIESPRNVGFAAANNLAIRAAHGRFVLLLNPDAELTAGAVPAMVQFLDAHAEVGLCGPRVVFPDGRFQSCGYAFPTLLSELRQFKRVDWLLTGLIGEPRTSAAEHWPLAVDWVDGACLMIRREVIDEIGPLDEQFFLYGEELDWCHSARKAGWEVFALPGPAVLHHQGQSSRQARDVSLQYLTETRLKYFRKHYGIVRAAAVSLVYVMGSLKQVASSWLGRGTPDETLRPRHGPIVRLKAVWHWWRGLVGRAQAV